MLKDMKNENINSKVKEKKNITEEEYNPMITKPCEIYTSGAYCCDWVPCTCPQRNKFVRVTNLNFLRVSIHINYLLCNVSEFLGVFHRSHASFT